MEMKRNPVAGMGKVFVFTLRQMLCKKSWLITTVLIAVLLLAAPPLIMLAASSESEKGTGNEDGPTITRVFVADDTPGKADYSLLKDFGKYEKVEYTACDSADAAIAAADQPTDLVLHVTSGDGNYMLTAILPDETLLSRSDASSFADFVSSNFRAVLLAKAELSAEAAALLSVPVSSQVSLLKTDASEKENDEDSLKQALGFIIPFLVLMMMYMMVILYGASMANSVMLEKTSKLMETMLTAVHPVALMGGKLLATASAAVLQILIWLAALLGGIFGGASIVMSSASQDSASDIVVITDAISGSSESLFSLPGIVLAVILIALGFLLYLSLGAISGALATKAEDLAKTNYVFMIVIIISTMLSISVIMPDKSGSNPILNEAAPWQQFFPFTAIMVAPARFVLGVFSGGSAVLTLLLMVLAVVLLTVLSAVIYKGLVLYRGEIPTPKKLIAMLKQTRSGH